MYTVTLLIGSHIIAEAKFKGITRVAKFVDSCDLDLVDVLVTSPKGNSITGFAIKEIWNA